MFSRSTRAAQLLPKFVRPLSTPAGAAWTRPLPEGALPVYDIALQYLSEDQAGVRKELEALRAGEGSLAKEEREKRIGVLEVLEGVNDPEVRWRFERGDLDMSKPYFRYLAHRKFFKEGKKDKLMERLLQMKVIPDVLPPFEPTAEMDVSFPRDERLMEGEGLVRPLIPGVFVRPGLTLEPPEIKLKIFDTEEKLYTLLIVDPDVPSPSTQSYTTYLHYLLPNIPLSHLSRTLPPSTPSHPWVPPHPQNGTPYHRYTLLLLSQPAGSVENPEQWAREGFSVREWAAKAAPGAKAVGAHMWRAIWDQDVSGVYERLGKREPKFGKVSRKWMGELLGQ